MKVYIVDLNEQFDTLKKYFNEENIELIKYNNKTHNQKITLISCSIKKQTINNIKEKLNEVKNNSNYVYLISNFENEEQIIYFLELGFDECLQINKIPKLLTTKVKKIFNKKTNTKDKSNLKINRFGLEIDIEARNVYKNGEYVKLTKTEFDLLIFFINSPEKIKTRDEIINKIKTNESESLDRTIDSQISKIRKKIAKDIIKTVRGIGYTFSNN